MIMVIGLHPVMSLLTWLWEFQQVGFQVISTGQVPSFLREAISPFALQTLAGGRPHL